MNAIVDLFGHALEHHRAGRLTVAADLYRRILSISPDHVDSLYLFSLAEYRFGRYDSAFTLISRALALEENLPDAYVNLGLILQAQNRFPEAEASYRRAIAAKETDPVGHKNLGTVLHAQGKFSEAEASYKRALALNKSDPESCNNLAAVLKSTGRFQEAESYCRQALAIRPDYPEALNHLGVIHRAQGRLQDAIAAHRQSLEFKPDYALAHNNLAEALLAVGCFEEGWPEYEWRWRASHYTAAQRSEPRVQWQGEPLPGRTLLVHAEQGFGDTLQFCRYVPLVVALGMKVVLEVPPPLVRLMRRLVDIPEGSLEVVGQGGPLPPFDRHCPMLSLPLAFGTRLDTIPNDGPYLSADPADQETWRERLQGEAGAFKVGLVWAGNPYLHSPEQSATDGRRSVGIEQLAPLLDRPGAQFYSLQKHGPKAPGAFGIMEMMGLVTDFADTAAFVANLDLVISVDTAVAHLAAALGRPVWLMNRFDSCWRWLDDRDDSPWYPTLRLFRQPRPGDWETVVDKVGAELRAGSVQPAFRSIKAFSSAAPR